MEHKKYKSIENSYNGRYVRAVTTQHALESKRMIMVEKLDGANLQLLIEPSGAVKVGKRSQWLEPDENFFNVWNTLLKYEEEINWLKSMAKSSNQVVRAYGELFGKGINDRVDYGPEQYIRLFDLYVGDTHMSPKELYEEMDYCNLLHFHAPVLGFTDGLLAALDKTPEFQSVCGHSPAEGFVVRAFESNVTHSDGSVVLIKHKSRAFAEKEQQNHKVKSLKKYDTNLFALNESFKAYVNKNRLQSVISKEGPVTDPKQIGTYIKLLLNDAIEDFKKDHDVSELNDKDLGFVCNVGPIAAQLVKAEIAKS